MLSEGTRAELSSARERAILVALSLQVNRVVPVEQLIDAVWGDAPPATARSQVQQCISALRRKLAPQGEVLRTESAGYSLRLPVDAVDATRFESLVSQSRAAVADDRIADAVADLRAATALWRGPACAGLDGGGLRAAATRLEEERLAALETCLDLELQLGRHREVAGELGGLVGQHPLRERLVALHMLALYRSGQKVAALDVFRAARATLVEELGVEPGNELSALQRGMLADDPALDHYADETPRAPRASAAAVPVPRQLPSAVGDFTGRAAEAGLLTELLSAPDEAAGRAYLPIAVVRGRGGVGKTALALHVAHTLRRQYPDGQLYAQLRDGEGQPISADDVLAWFLRALGLPPAALPAEPAERAATYRSLLGERRVLIVLDDAYSVSQLQPLIPGNPGCGLIVTSRDALSGLSASRYLDLSDLDEGASVQLLTSLIGDRRVAEEPAAALDLARQCGCLPLALRIVAARLVARPHWKLSEMVRRLADEEKRLDELAIGEMAVRATVALGYEGLDPDARRLFRLLGLLGATDFGSWMPSALLGCDADRGVELLDLLADARLVDVQVSDGRGVRFRLHELVRIYARERLAAEEPPPGRAAALGRMLGCWLGLAEEAHRRTYGGDFAVLHGTARRFPLPPPLADELLASPLGWLRAEQAGLVSAVHQAAQAGLHELCWDLAMTLVTLFESDHQGGHWRRTHEVALSAARRSGDQLGEAAMLCSLGGLAIAEQPARAAEPLNAALSIFQKIGHRHGEALALAGLAFIDRLNGHYEQALGRYARALDNFREAGDRVGEVDVLSGMAQVHLDRNEIVPARELLDLALRACETLAAPRIVAQTDFRMGLLLLRSGELTLAERYLRLSLQVVRDEGDTIGEAYALHALAAVHASQRRRAIADAEFAAALDLSQQVGEKLVRGRILLAYAEAQHSWQNREQARALAEEALAIFGEVGGTPVLRARAVSLREDGTGPDWTAAASLAPGAAAGGGWSSAPRGAAHQRKPNVDAHVRLLLSFSPD
jgi:DNA-binding SARP family transcriptional activator/tetratricopeptide (TPR) repeat protein